MYDRCVELTNCLPFKYHRWGVRVVESCRHILAMVSDVGETITVVRLILGVMLNSI